MNFLVNYTKPSQLTHHIQLQYLSIFSYLLFVALPTAIAQDTNHLKLASPYNSFVEEGFPFFTQTLDARNLGDPWPKDNLTPRGIILKLGSGYYACFDIDLLRVALVWKQTKQGEYLTMTGMAPGSYRLPNKKASAGQNSLPKPKGTIIAANGLYPGWGKAKVDNRKKLGAAENEPGLGPAPGLKWQAIEIDENGRLTLKYTVDGVTIEENWNAATRTVSVRSDQPLTIHWDQENSEIIPATENKVVKHRYSYAEVTKPKTEKLADDFFSPNFTTSIKTTKIDNGFKIEEVGLPLPNSLKRNVRLSAMAFFKNGEAVIATFDGDIWSVKGLSGDLKAISWTRIASGLHEPIGLEIFRGEIYVFTRNGIVKIKNTRYENFSSVVPQTAETREFANDIVNKPGGGFYLAKGGQIASTKGIANGTIVEVSPDGQDYNIICTGLRMPYIGVDPQTGMITASDQQGHWKPTTPIHIIKPGEYYGFQPSKFKDKAVHPHPIVEPQIWIPHFVNQSSSSQVWLRDAKMGVLNDSLVLVGYNRPEILKLYFEKAPQSGQIIQGGVATITHQFASGLLKGKVHPVDGSLWLTGFKIWGTSAEQISGLYRVTPTGAPVWTPETLATESRGVLLKFSQPVDAAIASALSSYSVDRWNYKRTHNYGSGHYLLSGEPGQESMPVASIKLSKDRKSLFLGIPDMKPTHALRVTYKVPTAKGAQIAGAFYTIHQLVDRDLIEWGFADNRVDLELKQESLTKAETVTASKELGLEVSTKYGCIACHAAGEKAPIASVGTVAGNAQVAVGPGWNGLWNSKRKFTDGTEMRKVDAVYLKESILDPTRKVALGFETEKTGVGMPSYLGVLKDHEIESVILYIKSLHKVKPVQ